MLRLGSRHQGESYLRQPTNTWNLHVRKAKRMDGWMDEWMDGGGPCVGIFGKVCRDAYSPRDKPRGSVRIRRAVTVGVVDGVLGLLYIYISKRVE